MSSDVVVQTVLEYLKQKYDLSDLEKSEHDQKKNDHQETE